MSDNEQIVKYQTESGEVVLTPDIVKRYLVSGRPEKVTDQEVMMFLNLCKYQRLNPFIREAYLVKYSENQPASMVVGKDTLLKRAARNPNLDGMDAGVIVRKGDEIIQRSGTLVLDDEELVGGWAKVYRKDWKVPLEVTVNLREYRKTLPDGRPMANWATMPATMIRKVALAQALREAFPEDCSQLYAAEEMPIGDTKLDETPIPPEVILKSSDGEIEEEVPIKAVISDPKENTKKRKAKFNSKALASDKQIKYITGMLKQVYGDNYQNAVNEILSEFKKNKLEELTIQEASKVIEKLRNNSIKNDSEGKIVIPEDADNDIDDLPF